MRFMKALPLISVTFFPLLGVACKELPAEVEVSETRPLTSHDKDPEVNASSAKQFLPPDVLRQVEESGQKLGDDKSEKQEGGKWTYQLPAQDWKDAGAKMFRELNFTFGEGEKMGEAYLSAVGGGLQANIDRWFRQFANEPKPLDQLDRIDFLGQKGYLIEAVGRFEPGMGRPGKDEQALLGAMIEKGGRLITVKMIGPKAEMTNRREEFLKFVASLQQK